MQYLITTLHYFKFPKSKDGPQWHIEIREQSLI